MDYDSMITRETFLNCHKMLVYREKPYFWTIHAHYAHCSLLKSLFLLVESQFLVGLTWSNRSNLSQEPVRRPVP